jgi:hypothetical protein
MCKITNGKAFRRIFNGHHPSIIRISLVRPISIMILCCMSKNITICGPSVVVIIFFVGYLTVFSPSTLAYKCTASDGGITNKWWTGKDLEGIGRSLIKVSRQLPGRTEESHEKLWITNAQAEIRLEHLPNRSLERSLSDCWVRCRG